MLLIHSHQAWLWLAIPANISCPVYAGPLWGPSLFFHVQVTISPPLLTTPDGGASAGLYVDPRANCAMLQNEAHVGENLHTKQAEELCTLGQSVLRSPRERNCRVGNTEGFPEEVRLLGLVKGWHIMVWLKAQRDKVPQSKLFQKQGHNRHA